MPNVSHLLNVATDDPSLTVPRIPEGTWRGELKRLVVVDKDKDGNDLTDKNGDAYTMVRLLCVPATPEQDVDKKSAEAFIKADGPNEVGLMSMMQFVRRKRDVLKINQILDSLGVPRKGRTLNQIAKEFKGGIPCLFEVVHRDTEDRENEDIVAIYPVS